MSKPSNGGQKEGAVVEEEVAYFNTTIEEQDFSLNGHKTSKECVTCNVEKKIVHENNQQGLVVGNQQNAHDRYLKYGLQNDDPITIEEFYQLTYLVGRVSRVEKKIQYLVDEKGEVVYSGDETEKLSPGTNLLDRFMGDRPNTCPVLELMPSHRCPINKQFERYRSKVPKQERVQSVSVEPIATALVDRMTREKNLESLKAIRQTMFVLRDACLAACLKLVNKDCGSLCLVEIPTKKRRSGVNHVKIEAEAKVDLEFEDVHISVEEDVAYQTTTNEPKPQTESKEQPKTTSETNWVKDKFNGFIEWIWDAIAWVFSWLWYLVSGLLYICWWIITGIFWFIVSAIWGAITGIASWFGHTWFVTQVTDFAKYCWDGIKNFALQNYDSANDFVSNEVKPKAKDLLKKAYETL